MSMGATNIRGVDAKANQRAKVRAWMLAAKHLEMSLQEGIVGLSERDEIDLDELRALEHGLKVIVPNLVRRAEIIARSGRRKVSRE